MPQQNTIEDCPCCDGTAVRDYSDGLSNVRCEDCGLRTPFGDPDETLATWNSRSNNEENERQRGDEQFDRAENLLKDEARLQNRLDKIQEILNGDEDDEDES